MSKSLDKNGYATSILDTSSGEDFWSKQESHLTVRHEIYFGNKNRSISKANGFWVYLSPASHEYIHSNIHADQILKEECQLLFEETHTREEFRTLIGRSYL